ncbi:hypothetical protein DSO57_1029376 [Entomophthora muscae]|uniref:Uncharacterized protein n=1 Tax=Entomophthora muscae TaxID=34485 RepID=A0ACC2TNF7_9FUNG|nr:hypothetical protein DSO57_1029376 [Entomophthora muscae]
MPPLLNVVQRHTVPPRVLQGVLCHSHLHPLVAHRPDTDGFERLLPSVVPGVLPVIPLQAAIPVLHWMASWWFVSPGWEPNLVSLASLSHTLGPDNSPKQPISSAG